MNMDNKISRRDFIKASVVTGGTLLASTAIPGQAMNLLQGQKNDNKFAGDELLKGVCDIHLHCRPDSRERSVDEYGFMKDAIAMTGRISSVRHCRGRSVSVVSA